MADASSPDVFADEFSVNLSPWGGQIHFRRTPPGAMGSGSPPESADALTVRTSVELLMALSFLLRRQIRETMLASGHRWDLPPQVLNGMGISPDDWSDFWS